MPHDPKQLDDLSARALKVLGSEQLQTLMRSRPRSRAYSTALNLAIKEMGSPDKVTDEQVLGALEIAHEIFPVELEAIADALARCKKIDSD